MGCTATLPIQNPTPIIRPPIISSSKEPIYGYVPLNYKSSIKSYFKNRLKRGNMATYLFSKPQKAFKRKGLAYGGDVSWRGWLVDVAVTTQSRTGRVLSPKSYMVLFKNSVIVEDIRGKKHSLLTRVGGE